jgi:hypothetical protein
MQLAWPPNIVDTEFARLLFAFVFDLAAQFMLPAIIAGCALAIIAGLLQRAGTGAGALAITNTVQAGNQIGGTFVLEFQGFKTAPVPSDVTAQNLQAALQALPLVVTCEVSRIDH